MVDHETQLEWVLDDAQTLINPPSVPLHGQKSEGWKSLRRNNLARIVGWLDDATTIDELKQRINDLGRGLGWLEPEPPPEPETEEHVVLVAFQVEGTSKKDVHEYLMNELPIPQAGNAITCWWVAEDERYDGSDNDSAIFIPQTISQEAARAQVLKHMRKHPEIYRNAGSHHEQG